MDFGWFFVIMSVREKIDSIKDGLSELDGVVVGFSGGIDSSVVAKLTKLVQGEDCIAVTVASELFPRSELEAAEKIAEEIGIKHKVIERKLEDLGIENNPEDRCYLCKRSILVDLKEVLDEYGYESVVDGTNATEAEENRPGIQALEEMGIYSPLSENKVTRKEVREIAEELGLSNRDKPPESCLATRFPFGQKLDPGKLEMVEKAEEKLKDIGFKRVRVRVHENGSLARIELKKETLPPSKEEIRKINRGLKEIGFNYITLDLGGYQTGKMS
ncbi:MAG: ATP-utilizing enzyme of the PP-loop superfamily [Candidatus Methanohalarchaeum thermophilum]|uniref:ATP-utilizing enzyme of the PP-loop superfamily n=1 Tax=Methanohalarchaeum thermophilum TaxID=1903181 RepID=A0A1Q6DSH3_METT1|nr:MAG: ATP-utilizing enzyme of the PP-loop superfamily [Candidatus Methanohalarchaeum thermophilum]